MGRPRKYDGREKAVKDHIISKITGVRITIDENIILDMDEDETRQLCADLADIENDSYEYASTTRRSLGPMAHTLLFKLRAYRLDS
jgi:hypothetical protein